MKNSKLRITSHSSSHPEDTSEGSARFNTHVDSSLSLRMALGSLESLICKAK